jgi:hypothetical protein
MPHRTPKRSAFTLVSTYMEPPRRNRTGDPILTMEPPGTAVRNALSPGHARPSGPKLSVLFRRSYAFSFVTQNDSLSSFLWVLTKGRTPDLRER